ncbi:PEP/pyruvate-binding domain-containing protein [Desulfonatronovibrio magnus]|uniref:PEP/pyruvate-binding domain-containing protein n=1 Tax=Desulfonatronovibrio magnus TaxID=698827 RepID=UPI0005EB94DF|nr:PEP/pyruvate-binding domain-containing protein [Desulfonatronovibrio magnus]
MSGFLDFLISKIKRKNFDSIEDALFKRKYEYFKSLLANNNKALVLISSLEDLVLEHRTFDYNEIVSQCEQLISTVYDISEDVNAISGGKYSGLFEATEKIGISILHEFMDKRELESAEWAISLKDLTRDKYYEVGGKAANLGEVLNRVGLSAPSGFSITAYACHQFLKQGGISELVKKKLKNLSVSDTEKLNNICAEIKAAIMSAPLPRDLEESIMQELGLIQQKHGSTIRMAVRSSATGEDSESSFAGQHSTLLNVPPDSIIQAYKEVVASTFNPRAVFYRRSKGYRDTDVVMSVLCLIMVDSASSGVLYSVNPTSEQDDDLYISANWGLGVSVVDGSMPTDFWRFSRESGKVVSSEIKLKKEMIIMDKEQGIVTREVPADFQNAPCLNQKQIETLVDYALKLEKHFSWPVDMEWAVDKDGTVLMLQARPLNRIQEDYEDDESIEHDLSHHDLILEGGMTACSGTATGPAYHVQSDHNLSAVPEGAIIIAPQTSPRFVSIMSRISGIITDVGSVTGHMSSVAREFRLPTLVATSNATKLIPNYQVITLDATRKKVYSGEIQSLLRQAKPVNLMKDSPVWKLVHKTIKKIIPLNLIDPKKCNFIPAGCVTLHDIVRFSHEMAMREMFNLSRDISTGRYRSTHLDTDPDLKIEILDLGGGLKSITPESKATPGHILSMPFKALLTGMFNENVHWATPADLDMMEFASIMKKKVMEEPGPKTRMSRPNYAIISKEYLNFNASLGYHYVTVDAYCSKFVNDNYITFSFKGGAADVLRRTRRAGLIGAILKKLGFRVELNGDMVRGEMKKYDCKRLGDRLDHIGRLLGSILLLDMVLSSDQEIDWYVEQFMKGNYTFTSEPAGHK